ncbi:hypothetical protein BTHE68_35470 [Burkholderia sp. THE68]|uniref:hypothetical protein n=1 Tax=Burkholderia sp. THE68 TaxID=758782 RepID=UPI0013195129|nr:hypothetical protein [Burkholderia sp. THE68]BBU29813.1 hypothetical protein BTHE68_35470 [Burkholderia sp. THE68]
MAAKTPRRPSLFALAERQIIALYDAGVMSPAVLHHVLAAYADSGIDWNDEGTLQTVDGHTVQQAVVLVMMPGRALKSAKKDFMSVVEHLAVSEPEAVEEQTEDAEDDDDLLAQLGGDTKKATRAKKSTQAAEPKRAAFNPLVGARAVKGNKR